MEPIVSIPDDWVLLSAMLHCSTWTPYCFCWTHGSSIASLAPMVLVLGGQLPRCQSLLTTSSCCLMTCAELLPWHAVSHAMLLFCFSSRVLPCNSSPCICCRKRVLPSVYTCIFTFIDVDVFKCLGKIELYQTCTSIWNP